MTENRGHVLVVDDEPALRRLAQLLLESSGYTVTMAADGLSGLASYDVSKPDLVLLDVGLPGMDGWDVLAHLRDRGDIPVIMLTAHGSEPARVKGLRSGADDYVVKPFSNTELIARIQAVMRRARPAGDDAVIVSGPLRIDRASRVAHLDERTLDLSAIEWRLLLALASSPGSVVSNARLLELAWHDPSGIGTERVKFAVLRLRRELTAEGRTDPIRTLRGMGYQWIGFNTGD
jgi:DNA-binding response OmpR family regulator